MEEGKIIAQINEANTNRYSDGKVVDEYLDEKYHKVRIEIALKLLYEGVKKQFPNFPNEEIKILDIGCGSGKVSKMIHASGYSVVAADFTITQIELQPKERFISRQFDANEKFPFPDNCFHSVFSGELIEHLFDTKLFLSECKRVLKPNGILILTTPNLAGVEDRVKFFFGVSPRHVNPLHPYLKLHIRQFTKSSLKRILKTVGFDFNIIKSNYIKIYLSENRKIYLRLLAKMFPSLGGSLISCSIKK